MSVRTRYKIHAAISSTSAEDRDLGNTFFEVVTDTSNKGGTWKTQVLPGAVDQQFHLDNLTTANLLILRTAAQDPNLPPCQVNVKLDSIVATMIPILPLDSAVEGHLVLSSPGISFLYLSNPGTVIMDVTITASGN